MTMEQAVNSYSDMIYRIALHYVPSADAFDVVQEVFLQIVKRPQILKEEYLKFWLIKVTKSKALDILKKERRHQNQEIVSHQEQDYSEVWDAIKMLKNEDKILIYLFYYEDLSVKEIAKILRKKENAIYTRISRARQTLKNILISEDNL